jgi:hypothetical protein
MDAYGILYEDPVAVLKEIYQGYEPDSDLKAWARKFLVRVPSTSSPEYHTTSLSLSTMEPPNLLKLESEQGSYRARFLDAVENSGALENDVNKARQELKDKGWYSWTGSAMGHSGQRFLTDRSSSYSPHPLALGLGRRSPLLLGGSRTSSFRDIPSLSDHLSSLDIDRLLHEKTREREKLRDWERIDVHDLERERLRELQREKERDLERERDKLRRLERDKEKVRETRAQMQTAAALEAFHGRNLGGFVEEY